MFGAVSGGLVVVSGLYYFVNICRGAARPNLTTWSLWTVIGLAILVTYRSSGAKDNVWPAVFGFINPFIITGAAFYKHGKWEKLQAFELVCIVGCFVSLLLWGQLRNSKELVQFALYGAIVADFFAWLPTFDSLRKNPKEDRPFPWIAFGIGYYLSIFAITEPTFANYSLPVYMTIGSLSVAYLLGRHRVEHRSSLKHWF